MNKMGDLQEFIMESRMKWPSPQVQLISQEWDISDMFNNISIDQTKKDLDRLIRIVRKLLTRMNRQDLHCHMGEDPIEDYLNTTPSVRGTQSISMKTLKCIIHYDLDHNKKFRIRNCIFVQKMGTAQGGYLSSELACLNVETREDIAHKHDQLLRSSMKRRFRDNLIIIATMDDPIWENTKNKLNNIYKLPIKIENNIHTPALENFECTLRTHEQRFTTLESTLTLTTEYGITLSMKNPEFNVFTWNKSSGLRKWISRNSEHYNPITELTMNAYFHKSMQLAVPTTQRKLNLLNLALNSYRHGCNQSWITSGIKERLLSSRKKYGSDLNEARKLHKEVIQSFENLAHLAEKEPFWLDEFPPLAMDSRVSPTPLIQPTFILTPTHSLHQ